MKINSGDIRFASLSLGKTLRDAGVRSYEQLIAISPREINILDDRFRKDKINFVRGNNEGEREFYRVSYERHGQGEILLAHMTPPRTRRSYIETTISFGWLRGYKTMKQNINNENNVFRRDLFDTSGASAIDKMFGELEVLSQFGIGPHRSLE